MEEGFEVSVFLHALGEAVADEDDVFAFGDFEGESGGRGGLAGDVEGLFVEGTELVLLLGFDGSGDDFFGGVPLVFGFVFCGGGAGGEGEREDCGEDERGEGHGEVGAGCNGPGGPFSLVFGMGEELVGFHGEMGWKKRGHNRAGERGFHKRLYKTGRGGVILLTKGQLLLKFGHG